MTCKILLVLAFLAILSSCRRYETSVKFSHLKEHNGWYYLQKFKFAEGIARFELQLYVRGKAKSKSQQIYIQGVPSEKWEAEEQKKCNSPIAMPVMIENLRMTGQKTINKFQFSVSHDNTYYFVIKDCFRIFRRDYDNQDLVLYVKFHAFSNDIDIDDAPEKLNEVEPEQVIYQEQQSERPAEADENTVEKTELPVEQEAKPVEEVDQAVSQEQPIRQEIPVQEVQKIVQAQEIPATQEQKKNIEQL